MGRKLWESVKTSGSISGLVDFGIGHKSSAALSAMSTHLREAIASLEMAEESAGQLAEGTKDLYGYGKNDLADKKAQLERARAEIQEVLDRVQK